MPAAQHPTTHFFTDWMPFVLPNQQRQSTAGEDFMSQSTQNDSFERCSYQLISSVWYWKNSTQQKNNNNNDRLTAFDPGQPG